MGTPQYPDLTPQSPLFLNPFARELAVLAIAVPLAGQGKRCPGALNVRIACPVLFDAAQFAIHSFRIHLADGIMGRARETI